jgi:hypothetical protein
MDVTKPYEFIRFGAMDVTKPYEFIGFGAMDVTKPHEFIGFGAMDVTTAGSRCGREAPNSSSDPGTLPALGAGEGAGDSSP